MVLVFWLNDVSSLLLIRSKRYLTSANRLLHAATEEDERIEYSDLAQKAMGKLGVVLVDLSLLLTLLGACAAYQITVSKSVNELFPSVSTTTVIFFSTLVILPFAVVRNIAAIAPISLLGLITYVFAIIAILIYGFANNPITWNESLLRPGSTHELMEFVGVVSFSLGVPLLALPLEEGMYEPFRFKITMRKTLLAVFGAYLVVAVVPCLLFPGASLQEVLVSNLPPGSALGRVVRWAVIVTMLCSIPLLLVPALNTLEKHLPNRQGYQAISALHKSPPTLPPSSFTASTWIGCGARALAIVLVGLLAVSVPCFTLVISVLGCVTLGLLCFIFPPLFCLRLDAKYDMGLSATDKAECFLVLACGVGALLASLSIVMQGKC